MARPIKDTPIIWGKDAKRFTEAMENPVPLSKEKCLIRNLYEKNLFNSIDIFMCRVRK
jgi:hypothetical protein